MISREDVFNMDFRFPFSPYQAFAICLEAQQGSGRNWGLKLQTSRKNPVKFGSFIALFLGFHWCRISKTIIRYIIGSGFKYFLISPRIPGEMVHHFDGCIFFKGVVNQPPTRNVAYVDFHSHVVS